MPGKVLVSLVILAMAGCAYRLPAPIPPSQENIRILAASPDEYAVRVNTRTPTDLRVPADGRVVFTIPGYRMSCQVYLFNEIRMNGANDPLRTWNISVTRRGKVVRKLSLRQVQYLKSDQDGYHVLDLHQ